MATPHGNWNYVGLAGLTSTMNRFAGRCHCGKLEVEFDTEMSVDELPLRADQCSFCRKHWARTTSDPNGRVRISVHDSKILRYRFGLKTADFLVCEKCGVYIAAVISTGNSSYATLNINVLDRAAEFTRAALPVSYESESASERIERRMRNWTPAEIEESE
jgi:hypothetical protein